MDGGRLAVLKGGFHQAGGPRVRRGMGVSLVGPSVIVHVPPEEQNERLERLMQLQEDHFDYLKP